MTRSLYDLSCRLITGKMLPLSQLRGQVLLIVNTASHCGLTPQYAGLEKLHRTYHDRGFSVLGFPSNDFLEEPRAEEHIHDFCLSHYHITFPLFAKIAVNGRRQDPLFAHLKEQAPGLFASRSIKWNFSKFLIDRNGRVVARHSPLMPPRWLRRPIEKLLEQSASEALAEPG